VSVQEPAPVGPQLALRAGRLIEGGWAARLDGYGGMEEPDGASHTGLLGVSTWTSTGLPRASRQKACAACCRTAPRPTSATPRERAPRRAGMSQGRAQMIHSVKSKVRTNAWIDGFCSVSHETLSHATLGHEKA
jgi:hypothetical protein